MDRVKINGVISGEANEIVNDHKLKNGFKYKEEAINDIILKFKKLCDDGNR